MDGNTALAERVSAAATPREQGRQVLSGVRRPAPALLRYYMLISALTGPALIVLVPYRYFRYRTLRYQFDDEGVTMRWGILFRREISLTYARIQDIHLVSNVVERWMGLGRVQIQTASGQSGAEMTIEGLPDFEAVRDELYRRMRGARDPRTRLALSAAGAGPAISTAAADSLQVPASRELAEATEALRGAVAELRAIRKSLAEGRDASA